MTLLIYPTLVIYFISFVSAQAPGDVSQYCIDNSLVPDYLDTVKPLMDSSSYKYLLGDNGVWQSINLDIHPETWILSEDVQPCSNILKVNEPSNVPQHNWLITQHISKSIAQQSDTHPTYIHVNITFRIDSSCDNCSDHFQLLIFYANSSIADVHNRTIEFTAVGNLTNNDNSFVTVMKKFIIDPDQDGFYLALEDFGTNVTVSRFLVYRVIGPATQVGLTYFPETAAPVTDHVHVSGMCVTNANSTTGKKPELTLYPNGNWSLHDQDQCFCIEGHEKVQFEGSNQCQACDPGTYKSLKDNSECLNCPINSLSTVHGASICPCETNYYRAPTETEDVKCTGPPGAPGNLRTSDTTGTTVVLLWDAPVELGGRSDLYYDVFFTSSSSVGQNNIYPVNTTTYLATNLTPLTFYQITVIAENGVSSQAGNEYLRSATTFVTTAIGAPPMVTGVSKAIGGTVVEWLPTSSVNGPITQYEVQFFSSEANGIINTVDNTLSYYEVNITTDFPVSGQPVRVQVRANTSAGAGDWSDPIVFAQVNPRAPTSITTSNPVPSTSQMTTMSVSLPPVSSSSASKGSVSNVKPTASSSIKETALVTSSLKTSSTSAQNPPTTPPSTSKPPSTSSTAPPGESEESNPVVAIVAVLSGAVGILIIVAIGALGYFIFRTIRRKKEQRQEDIDYAPLVHYNPTAMADSEDEIKVELKDHIN